MKKSRAVEPKAEHVCTRFKKSGELNMDMLRMTTATGIITQSLHIEWWTCLDCGKTEKREKS